MPYLGNAPGAAFTQTIKDTFSGDDSSTTFTLSVDNTTNNVEVFVENVQQEPTVAYTISRNRLIFSEAPPLGSSNIYVIHRDPAQQTAAIDSFGIPDNSITNALLANDSVSFAEITLTAANGIIRSTGSGQMYIAADSDIFLTSQDFLYTYADFRYANGVRLYWNNNLRFTTDSIGINVTGAVYADSFYGDGSALTGIDALPSQTGNANKYLTTDGTDASWDSVQIGAINDVFWTNAQNLAVSYTLGANRSAVTAGPLTLDSGVTVTLDSNARWVIV